MRIFTLLSLIIFGGCATRFYVPGNRFITPESQGGLFHGQAELQVTRATEVQINTKNQRIDEGATYERVSRTGYMYSTSIFEILDFVWSHNASASSMAGGKIQVIGASRTGKGAGHKLSIVGLVGGNEHENRAKTLKFRLDAQEFLLIYGYRINDIAVPYVSVGNASYKWVGQLYAPQYPAVLDGVEITMKTDALSCNFGVEGDYQSFFGKAELSYQEIETTDTAKTASVTIGFAAGVNW